MIDEEKLKSAKPEEIKKDKILSDIWDKFTQEAISKEMLYKD